MKSERTSNYRAVIDQAVSDLRGLGMRAPDATFLAKQSVNRFYSENEEISDSELSNYGVKPEDVRVVLDGPLREYAEFVKDADRKWTDLTLRQRDGGLSLKELEELDRLEPIVDDYKSGAGQQQCNEVERLMNGAFRAIDARG